MWRLCFFFSCSCSPNWFVDLWFCICYDFGKFLIFISSNISLLFSLFFTVLQLHTYYTFWKFPTLLQCYILGLFFFSYFFLLAFQFGTFLLIFLYVHWIQLCHIYWWAHQRHSSFMLLYFFTSRSSFWFFPSFCLHYPYVLSLYLFIPLEFIML